MRIKRCANSLKLQNGKKAEIFVRYCVFRYLQSCLKMFLITKQTSTGRGVLSTIGMAKWVAHAPDRIDQSAIYTSRLTYVVLSFFAQGVQILEHFEFLSIFLIR